MYVHTYGYVHMYGCDGQSCGITVITNKCRGKGEYYRLGNDNNSTFKEPHPIETIPNKVIQIAVGSLHCLVLTENGEVGHQSLV